MFLACKITPSPNLIKLGYMKVSGVVDLSWNAPAASTDGEGCSGRQGPGKGHMGLYKTLQLSASVTVLKKSKKTSLSNVYSDVRRPPANGRNSSWIVSSKDGYLGRY